MPAWDYGPTLTTISQKKSHMKLTKARLDEILAELYLLVEGSYKYATVHEYIRMNKLKEMSVGLACIAGTDKAQLKLDANLWRQYTALLSDKRASWLLPNDEEVSLSYYQILDQLTCDLFITAVLSKSDVTALWEHLLSAYTQVYDIDLFKGQNLLLPDNKTSVCTSDLAFLYHDRLILTILLLEQVRQVPYSTQSCGGLTRSDECGSETFTLSGGLGRDPSVEVKRPSVFSQNSEVFQNNETGNVWPYGRF